MPKTTTDKWPIRHMRLDTEVFEAVLALKAAYGSYNKGLRAALIRKNSEISGKKDVFNEEDVKDLRYEPDESS